MATRGIALLSCALLVAGLVGVLGFSGGASAEVTELGARLTGAKEIPDAGDPDGRGVARVRLFEGRRMVCFRLGWRHIQSPFMAHIHEGTADVAGDIVVVLFMEDPPVQLPEQIHAVKGCAKDVSRALIRDIAADPRKYYVNIHNPDFPAGALRGQLHF